MYKTTINKKKSVSKKPIKKMNLSENQKKQLEKHKANHSTKHISSMRKMMKEGISFSNSHKKAMYLTGN